MTFTDFVWFSAKGKSVEHWILFDRLVQQIILQDTCDGIDHDVAVIQINVGEIIKQYVGND